jgi:hypothetical protein
MIIYVWFVDYDNSIAQRSAYVKPMVKRKSGYINVLIVVGMWISVIAYGRFFSLSTVDRYCLFSYYMFL